MKTNFSIMHATALLFLSFLFTQALSKPHPIPFPSGPVTEICKLSCDNDVVDTDTCEQWIECSTSRINAL
jgi:hypothetical protein